jgi:hypothetical protein
MQQSDGTLARRLQKELNAPPSGSEATGDNELARRLQEQFDEERRAKVEANKEDLFDVLSHHRTSIHDFLQKNWKKEFGEIVEVKENPFSRPGQPLYNSFVTQWQQVQDQKVQCVFHGTSESNIDAICRDGLDSKRRTGQAYGAGEYFAETNVISIAYCRGGKKMLVFAVLMDKTGLTTKAGEIVVINKTSHQLPLFVVSFQSRSINQQQLRKQQARSMALLSGAQRAFSTSSHAGGHHQYATAPQRHFKAKKSKEEVQARAMRQYQALASQLARPSTHRYGTNTLLASSGRKRKRQPQGEQQQQQQYQTSSSSAPVDLSGESQ